MFGGSSTNNLNASDDLIMSPGNGSALSGSGNEPLGVPVPAGTLGNLRASVSVAPGTGDNIVFTVLVDGAASAITCTIADTATSCEDLVNTDVTVDLEKVTVEAVSSATAVSSKVAFSLTHTP
jgi:type 1 fimbria pilin